MKKYWKPLGIFLLGAVVGGVAVMIWRADRTHRTFVCYENAAVVFDKERVVFRPAKGEGIVLLIRSYTPPPLLDEMFTTAHGALYRVLFQLPKDFVVEPGANCTVEAGSVWYELGAGSWAIQPGAALEFKIWVESVSGDTVKIGLAGDLPLQRCMRGNDGFSITGYSPEYRTLEFHDAFIFGKEKAPDLK